MTDPTISRRDLLRGGLGLGGVAALSGCRIGDRRGSAPITPAPSTDPTTGSVRRYRLNARPVEVDLGGLVASTWAYGQTVPGTALRAAPGDRVIISLVNDLPVDTSVHWHGLAIPNDMDGVPDVTTPQVQPGGTFTFDFVVPHPGTFWLHPHTGLQLDRGLYAAFIIDDPAEPGAYDHDWVLVLDDWTDGIGPSPEEILADLQAVGTGGMMGGPMMGGPIMGGMMTGADGGDVHYSHYLVNGRMAEDPDTLSARPGQRVRLRIINAAADTVFTVAVSGHELVVTHSDGYPVQPVPCKAVLVGMGERYDATITLSEGVFPLVAEPVGKDGLARALIRTGSGRVPGPRQRPGELDSPALTVGSLRAAPGAALPRREPDSIQDLALAGGMGSYVWTINGRTYDQAVPLTIRQGQAGRIRITNHSMMSHPVHVHGHTFQVGAAGGAGPRKDTVLVPPMGATSIDLAATNPGKWMIHCHNAYHAEAGMMTRLDYGS